MKPGVNILYKLEETVLSIQRVDTLNSILAELRVLLFTFLYTFQLL